MIYTIADGDMDYHVYQILHDEGEHDTKVVATSYVQAIKLWRAFYEDAFGEDPGEPDGGVTMLDSCVVLPAATPARDREVGA